MTICSICWPHLSWWNLIALYSFLQSNFRVVPWKAFWSIQTNNNFWSYFFAGSLDLWSKDQLFACPTYLRSFRYWQGSLHKRCYCSICSKCRFPSIFHWTLIRKISKSSQRRMLRSLLLPIWREKCKPPSTQSSKTYSSLLRKCNLSVFLRRILLKWWRWSEERRCD